MKVLVLDQFSELGGAQACLLMALSGMQASGWQVAVGLPGCGPLFDRIHQIGIETFPLSCGPFRLGGKSVSDAVRFLGQSPRLLAGIRDHLRSFNPDVLYVNGPRLLPAAAMAGPKMPVLFHAHRCIAGHVSQRVAGEALRRLNASMVACCGCVAAQWTRFVPLQRVSVIFNGVAPPPASMRAGGAGTSACATPRNDSAKAIGCIGRISPEKGQMEFVATAKAIHCAFPQWRFVVYGEPLFTREASQYYNRVLRAARGLPIEFAGWTSDIYAALSRLDLLLVPSDPYEATPRVILEAFAAGVPVIAFDVGGIPEVICHGRTGFLVRSGDEMARCAVELLSGDSSLLSSVSHAAREEWRARFTPECFQSRLLAALEAAARLLV